MVGRVGRCDGYGFLEPVAQSVGDGLARAGQRRGGKIARRERQKPGGQRIAAVFFAHIAEALQRMETAAGTRAVQAAEPRRFGGGKRRVPRSEEHTSELQSLMRISYAVFCLKKKTNEVIYLDSKQHNITGHVCLV